MKKGDLLRLTIEDVTFGSEGLARHDGRVVFVPGALPGEEVEAIIVKKRRDYARAQVSTFNHSSPRRTTAPCAHFGFCGGCQWQNVDYSYQLELKHRIVTETLRRLGGFTTVPIRPTLPSSEIFAYRNKMEFSFSAQRWLLPEETEPLLKLKDFALGFHMPGRFDRVLDIDRCWLQSDSANGILNCGKSFALASRKTAWDSHLHSGFWRFLMIREAQNPGQTMVNIVTYDHEPELLAKLTDSLLQNFPRLTSVVNNITHSFGGSAFGEAEFLLAGAPIIEEKLGGYFFQISANSFFQTNTSQAERLYQTALDFAQLVPTDIVFDLYSGTGTIAIYLSRFVARVVGVEVIESAVANARRNAERNGIDNCEFVLGDVRDEFRDVEQLAVKYGKPNVIILDPPRAGIHPKSLIGILALKPERIIYISCNPATFARDAHKLCETDYRLQQVQPVDMFPHTYHVELVAELQRRNV